MDNGRLSDVAGSQQAAGETAPSGITGVSDWSRSHTGDPTVGARPRRYTGGPTMGARPSHYILGRDGLGRSRQRPPGMLASSSSGDAVSEAGHSSTTGARLNDPAIAGDPHSVQRPVDRPRRAIRLPTRFKDFAV